MFDIRKIQESVIYHAVKNESDDETARKIVNGDKENNATWVKKHKFASHDKAKAAGISFRDGELYLQFPFCPCPMLAEVDKLETNTWCQCTTGYSKVIFEKAFGCEVDVELLKSIKMGDDICLMKIIPVEKIYIMHLSNLKHLSEVHTARSFLAGLILFVAAVGSVRADNTPEYTLQCEGIERVYRLHIPENMPENGPLVVVLHGYGSPKPGVLNETADRHGFAVCYPQGEKDGRGNLCWNVGYPFQHDMTIDDVEFLTQLVHHLQQKYGFSKQNVFCAGMSNGGEMCYLLAARKPDLFAAVAPISGLMMEWLYKSDTSTLPVPLFEIHGTDDKISAWEGDPDNKGGWGEYIPVPLAVHFCAAKNRCTLMRTDTVTGKAPNNRTIVKHRFSGGTNESEVWLYEMIGGKHSWFWDDMDTGDELWKFFSMYVDRE